MPTVPVTLLHGFHDNPRRGNVDAIVESLKAFGQFRPIVVNKGTKTGRPNEVLAGNHTLKAILKLQWTEVEVDWVDVDDETATKINLVDNRSADLAEYDHTALDELLNSILDYAGTGFGSADDAETAGTAAVKREAPKQQKPSGGQGHDQYDDYDKYKESDTRHLFLEWPTEEYDKVEADFRLLRKRWGMTTGEVVRRLLDV